MRSVVLAIVTCAACAFDDPRYEDTSFACDADHPCPAGQACIAGRCQADVPGAANGVACGSAGTCAPGDTCCALSGSTPRCIAAGDTCNGASAACDGPEDCSGGTQCCGSSDALCTEAASCSIRICTDVSDCGGAAPSCCFLTPAPWGVCSVC